jgi:Cu-Zn family superoxide dismutase
MTRIFCTVVACVLIAACASTPDESLRATAQLQPTAGNKTFGEATFEQAGDKVHAAIYVQGLKPGQEHGLHIHEVGDCSSGDGMSAKGHFNPYGKPHGQPGSSERHAGDLPALKAGKDGRAKVDVMLDIVTVSAGPTSVVGRAVIVHADPDDYRTQPTGNAGARLACGVIRRD